MLRRLFSKRYIRILLWLFITFVTLVVLLYAWTNWSGRRRWAATKAMLEREGETLDFRKLLPETPPDAQNLLAIEPLRGITEAIDHDESKGAPGAKRRAVEKMQWEGKAPVSSGVETGEVADMQAWVKFLREAKYLDLPEESSKPGKDVLTALDATFPLLKQLADLAPQRRAAIFTPGLRERELPEMLFSLSLRHYTAEQTLTRALCLRARAAIDARQGAEAARCLLAAEKMGLGCAAEPLLIGFLVGNATKAMTNEGIWLGLRENVFAEEDLRMLYQTLGTHNLDKTLLQAFRGEMATGLNALEYLQEVAGGRKKPGKDVADAIANLKGLSLNGFRALPGGLFDHWKSVTAEQEWKHIIAPLQTGGIAAAVKSADGISEDLNAKQNFLLHPDYIMARMVVPAFIGISKSALFVQARERQVLAAIALERFYLKHAKYPAALQELVPEFATSVPLDPSDGKEVRYHTTPAGRYMLWCVGFDGKDDGGQIKKNTRTMKNPDYLGDWTWQYEPVPVKEPTDTEKSR
ncbi:hypothetical protein [Prosthecobacter sp.]|uniref:hypothetical protein n=1 Tax=Prosthecobacter sp. TaxID=1965333 RepID=UPI0024879CD0|nr:hypothetical protein [Prosthecobacter sp.]MDI1312965.1 hypothetical protein [Prosthecobacter sp.]